MRFQKDKIKKILVIRPDAIGDLVLTTPAIHALRKNFPDAHIAILVQKYTADLVKVHPDVDEVILDDAHSFSRIKEKKFDLAIDFFSFDYRYPLLALRAGIPYRIGDRSRLLLSPFYNWGSVLNYKDYTKHVVELNLDLLKKIGIQEESPQLHVHCPDSVQTEVKTTLEGLGVSDNDFLVGIHPGCGISRPWKMENYAKLCDTLSEKLGAKVILTGGPKEKEAGLEISSLAKHKPINFIEKTSLLELLALIKRINIFIGVDTGPSHLAAALKTPLVYLDFAKNIKPIRWGPWQARHVLIYCHPSAHCPILCRPNTCQEKYCTDWLTVDKIIMAVEALKNQKEGTTLADWQKQTYNTLVIADEENLKPAQQIISSFKNQGYHALLERSEHIKIKTLFKLIELENILILHHLGKKGFLSTWLANLLSGTFTSTGTVLVRGFESKNPIKQYIKTFKKTVL